MSKAIHFPFPTKNLGTYVQVEQLPVFLVYQLGVVFLNVRNATDLVTAQLMAFSHGDRLLYLGLTISIGLILCGVFAVLGTGTGISWLNDGLPASPATAGVAATPPARATPARIRARRFI